MKVNLKAITFKNNGVTKMKETFESIIKKLLKTISESAKNDISEYGIFPEVKHTLKNPDIDSLIEEISLRVAPFTDSDIPNYQSQRYLELLIKNRKTGQIGRKPLSVGTKDVILRAIKSKDLEESIKEASEEILKLMSR